MQPKPDRAAWLKGGTAHCDTPPVARLYPWRFVLLGAPGVGKGTQAEMLCERLGTCHLSTGDVFRSARTQNECERSLAMTVALECMRRGELVSDETVLDLVAERAKCLRCRGGFLLDGFPRTIAQAVALEAMLAYRDLGLAAAINYELPLEKIVARLSGRRICPRCRTVYHIETRPPKLGSVCDDCGLVLDQREDDQPEPVRARMEAYQDSTAPLIDFYRGKNLLVTVSADGTPEEIFGRTLEALQAQKHVPIYCRATDGAS